ncbi:LytTR family DNA-binding domain-containing protein [Runella sp. MFBS21]|uniref:LytR/AlgR family response regulator transcription factor n=1 Tax=Runella sp. MFBS21 TaxID=3034018 RepID=UPI0023F73469|nr:LytTR family DNA-binding domain-containing protein [Runella sp. MFBS21]MDF7816629.1 LytTR family DNA-binding domain-containing protein [Runella sp. MFBS21]
MKINTLIIDDAPYWQKIVAKFVDMNPLLHLIGTCDSAMQAYELIAEQKIDLLICDIEMPDLSGLNFVKSLQAPPLVIFVTAHRDYALDCYEVSPVDFLLKPLEYDRFLKAIEKVRLRMDTAIELASVEPYFFVRENLNYIQIRYRDVLYMKAQENFVQIVTKNEVYLPILTISSLAEKLKHDVFLRVHRSYLVHRDAIARIGKNDIQLVNGEQIPIGDLYRNKINQKHIQMHTISRNN